MLVVCLMLLIPSVSAVNWDNSKNQKDITFDGKHVQGNQLLEKYKPIEIKNMFGLGETLFEGYLSQHDDICGTDCSSTMEVKTSKDGVLINDVMFKTLNNGNWIEQSVRHYQFSYWGSIDDYQYQCKDSEKKSENGTKIQSCSNIKIGSHEGWVIYNVGDSLKKGTYTIKLDAEKKPSRTVDWIINTNGEWLESWATWGNISLGDDAEVILNSPANGATVLTLSQTFNASANVTGGATLTNMSLYTNETGTWTGYNATSLFSEEAVTTTPSWTSNGGQTGYTGIRITIGASNVSLNSVTKYSLITATHVYVGTSSQGSEVGTQAFSGDSASFSSPLILAASTIYYITFGSGGAGYNAYFEAPVTFTQPAGGEFTWDGRIDQGGTYYANGVSAAVSISIGSTSTTQNIDRIISGPTLWNVETCDSDGDCGFATSNYTVLLDTTAPIITVESPTGIIGYGLIGSNETLNVTFTDTNLDSCWYDYNGTNITIENCLTGVKNSTKFLLIQGDTNMTLYANDSIGNLNSTFISWDYNLTSQTQTFPSTSVESKIETYIANLSYNSSKFNVISASLNINGTSYVGTRTGSGDTAVFTTIATMPSVTTTTNFSTYWGVSLTDVTGTQNYNLTSNNVTVGIINMSLCGSPLTTPFWNFSILNESNSASINTTFDATFDVNPTGSAIVNTFSFTYTNGNVSEYDFCFSPSTENYTVDTAIKLTKTGYVDKFYNYQDVALTNTTRNDNLFMLLDGDSTSFIIQVVDTTAKNIENAEVKVQRYYPGTNIWAITEILTTNYEGKAVGHILSEDADYRFNVSLAGVSIYNSSATKITCETAPCTVKLVIPVNIATGYEELGNIVSSLTYSDSTNLFTYTYADTSGSFSRARLYVYKVWPSNSTLVTPCNETKTTTSGVITCDINGQVNGTYRATGYIKRVTETLDKRIDGTLGTSIYNSLGTDGVLWAFFVFIGIIMIGLARPSLAIIFGIVGIVTLSVIGIINIGIISVVAISAIGVILLSRIGRE